MFSITLRVESFIPAYIFTSQSWNSLSLQSNSRPRRPSRPRRQDIPRNILRVSGAPRTALSGSGKPPTRLPLVFPLVYPRTRPLNYPERAGIPVYKEGVITPSHGHPETSASPTWASAAVTGTFHTLLTIYLRPGRTLPDSATRSPGLYSSTMDPSNKTHSLSLDNPTTQRSPIFLHNSVHHNVSVPNNKHLNSDKSRNHIKLRNTHIYMNTNNKAALSRNRNTSCYFNGRHQTQPHSPSMCFWPYIVTP